MNREIKFRAWDEKNKIIHNNFKYIKSGDTPMDWIIFQSDIETKSISELINNPYCAVQLKIMQYTGLKDKNGIEIFEDDIVKTYWQHCGITNYDYELTGIIRCSDYYSGFVITVNKDNKEFDVVLYSFETEEINKDQTEIIGNIYQNPELLEKK